MEASCGTNEKNTAAENQEETIILSFKKD